MYFFKQKEFLAGVKMKLFYRTMIASLIGLTFCFFACANDVNGMKADGTLDYEAIKDSTLHWNVTIYRIQEYNGDTSEWDALDCRVHDSNFNCRRVTNVDCNRDIVRMLNCRDANNNFIECPDFKDTIYDTTYKNLNFGKEALVNYIPVAKIPAFNRDSVAKLFSKISREPCSRLLSFSSNYYLEAIGLPDSLTLNLEREYIPEEYIRPKDFFVHLSLITNESTGEKTCRQDSSRIMYNFYPGTCYYSSLPEKAKVVNYELFNTTIQAYKDTTISWKLVYKDQYGRGDTLDITTKFE